VRQLTGLAAVEHRPAARAAVQLGEGLLALRTHLGRGLAAIHCASAAAVAVASDGTGGGKFNLPLAMVLLVLAVCCSSSSVQKPLPLLLSLEVPPLVLLLKGGAV
jgi:hypothetical protein